MSAYQIPIHQGRIDGSVDLNLSGLRVRYINPVDGVVAKVFGVPIEDLYRHCRGKLVDDARRALITLRKEYDKVGDTRLGRELGRDHGTIWHTNKRSRDLEQTDPEYRSKIQAARQALGL